jgi:hypothetical protein
MIHICEICNYTDTRSFNFNKHLETNKHIKKVKEYQIKVKEEKKEQEIKNIIGSIQKEMEQNKLELKNIINLMEKEIEKKDLEINNINNLLEIAKNENIRSYGEIAYLRQMLNINNSI